MLAAARRAERIPTVAEVCAELEARARAAYGAQRWHRRLKELGLLDVPDVREGLPAAWR